MRTTKRNTAIIVFILAVSVAMAAPFAAAQEKHSDALKPFLTDDVVAVAYADLNRLDIDATLGIAKEFGFEDSMPYRELSDFASGVKPKVEQLKRGGISRCYILLRMADIQQQATTFVMPLNGGDFESAKKAIESVVSASDIETSGYEIISSNGAIVISTPSKGKATSDLATETATDRSEMWNAVGNGTFGVAVFGDRDSRRVVSDLMPTLPPPFEALTASLVAKRTEWAGIELTLSQSPKLKIELETTDEASAQTWRSIIQSALDVAKSLPQITSVIPESEVDTVLKTFAPKLNGSRVSITVSEFKPLAKIIAPPLNAIRTAARQTQSLNNLRQLTLAMLNYESAYNHFPAQAIVNDDGKALLSWRVAILPFLDETKLYSQFHLDEPWDSEHNIKLVEKMPRVFWNTNSAFYEANKLGLTIYQVPTGKGLVFDGGYEAKFKDITDGSSNTICVVAMPEKHAVEWTKPADWKVDLDDPFKQVAIDGKEQILFSLCDGSTHRQTFESLKSAFRQLIDPSDGEAVEW